MEFQEIPLEKQDMSKEFLYCRHGYHLHSGGNGYTDYFTICRASENDYNANQDFRIVSSTSRHFDGLIADLYYDSCVYVNIDKYVLKLKLITLKNAEDGSILGYKGVELKAVFELTDKTPEEYFEDMFSKTATEEAELIK